MLDFASNTENPVFNPPRPPGLRACRLSGFCPPYPPPLLLFSKVLRTSPRFARFPTSVLTWHHQDAFKTASKPRTGLRTRPSAAKCLQELDFDVQKSLAPPKSAENDEKPKKNLKFFFEKIFSASKNQKLQIVRNAFSRSFAAIGAMFAEFVVASAGFAKRKQSAGVPSPTRVKLSF